MIPGIPCCAEGACCCSPDPAPPQCLCAHINPPLCRDATPHRPHPVPVGEIPFAPRGLGVVWTICCGAGPLARSPAEFIVEQHDPGPAG